MASPEKTRTHPQQFADVTDFPSSDRAAVGSLCQKIGESQALNMFSRNATGVRGRAA